MPLLTSSSKSSNVSTTAAHGSSCFRTLNRSLGHTKSRYCIEQIKIPPLKTEYTFIDLNRKFADSIKEAQNRTKKQRLTLTLKHIVDITCELVARGGQAALLGPWPPRATGAWPCQGGLGGTDMVGINAEYKTKGSWLHQQNNIKS